MAGQAVRIGSREFTVEQSPLRVNYFFYGTHSKFTVRQSEDGQLRLTQPRDHRVLGWIFCVLGWPVLILGLFALLGLFVMIVQLNRPTLGDVAGVFFLMVWGVPFSVFGVKLLGRRYRFDSQAGELTIRHFWRTRRRPLADIVAVQVINAGWFGSNNSEGDERFISYQLNLIRDDPSEPRLFVAYNHDLADMGTKAKQLADFLSVPLLTATQTTATRNAVKNQGADPTRHWAKTDEPLPPFDLSAGALGGLRLGDGLEQAEFLGRPDRVEHPGWIRLHYLDRGFQLYFEMSRFVRLTCYIELCRPRLSGGIVLTPETSVAQLQQHFGPPESEGDYPPGNKTLEYVRGRFYMEFEYEQSTGKLLIWSVALDD